jgi:hypothetical protein
LPVFDASTKTKTVVPDPGTDKRLAPSGSLSWGGICSPVGLAGTIGVDVRLDHGDSWSQITGNETINILENERVTVFGNGYLTVQQNQTTNIVGNFYETIVQSYHETIVGPHVQVNIGIRNNTFVSPKTEVHSAPKQTQEPAGWLQYIAENTKVYFYKFDIILGPKLQFALFETAISLIKLEAYGMKGSGVGLQVQLVCLKMDVKLSDNRILAMALKVSALNGHLGPIDMQGVALKLMELAFGVNQVI